MSDLTSTSYYGDNKKDNGISPIFLIFILLFLGGGDNCLLGGSCGGKSDCGCNSGLDGILPLLLVLLLCGGSF